MFSCKKYRQKLNTAKFNTIISPGESVSFQGIYHFYTCLDLGKWFGTCCRFLCYCTACNEMLQKIGQNTGSRR